MTKDKYLEMCDMMHREPDPELTPLDFSDFPLFMQDVLTITNMLSDRWDGMSGSYLGKDMSIVPYLFNVFEIDDPKMALLYINLIVSESQKLYNADLKAKRERAKRASKGKR